MNTIICQRNSSPKYVEELLTFVTERRKEGQNAVNISAEEIERNIFIDETLIDNCIKMQLCITSVDKKISIPIFEKIVVDENNYTFVFNDKFLENIN